MKYLLSVFFLFISCQSNQYHGNWTSGIDKIVLKAIASGKVAGISIGIAYGKNKTYYKSFGKADLEFDVSTPDNAIYEIGSVTKQFTAAGILKLAEEGKIDLDADIRDYLRDYDTQGYFIPVKRLLDHTSGIKGYTEMPSARPLFVQDLPRDSLVALFEAHPFDFPPGEQMIYNNSAYFLAGLIIEEVTEQSYEDYVQENFFQPAGMVNSRYCSEKAVWKNRAHGYDTDDKTGEMIRKGFIVHSVPYAAGSLCSTVRDLVMWNQTLHKGNVVSRSVYKEMITPGELNDGTILRYAKGLGLTKVAGRKAIHHGGGINGFLSQSLYFPEEDLTVVVLANTAGPISPSELAENIAIEILGSVAEEKITLDLSKNEIQKLAKVYSGVARGRKVNVEIAIDSNNLTYLVKNAEEKQGEAYSSVEDQSEPKILVYSGNGIFRDGRTNFIFQSRENDIEELRMDFGSGYSILKAN
jgi:CubicO group peptidase (beta-lactamase class C family)